MTAKVTRHPFVAIALITAAIVIGTAAPARATGPLYVCESGRPWLWPNGGANIAFSPDQGGLGPLSNAAAVALVQRAFDVWGAVPTSSVSYLNAGPIAEDVNASNFYFYLFKEQPLGFNAIVFDGTGEIFDLLFGEESSILGFAGPEFGVTERCELTEASAFLNGPAFTEPVYAFDVMVHEFGHYANLGHSVVNGQLFIGDTSGPRPFNTFGSPSTPTVVETMYPFYFGPGTDSGTLEADDIAGVSTLYPEPAFFPGTGSIRGTIYAQDGRTRLTGVNVIARNVANPFGDAVSALSGDYTVSVSSSDPAAGTFTLNGLTPGATYAVFVDQIVAGAFSTPIIFLPAPEEFYSGTGETNNREIPDPPSTFAGVTVSAGARATGIDVILNDVTRGQAIPLVDDGAAKVTLPFVFTFCGIDYDRLWINSNGNLTFISGEPTLLPSAFSFVVTRPRIAPLWTDLNPFVGGSVVYDYTANEFFVTFTDVPEYPNVGANTFRVTLHRSSNQIDFDYGSLTATGGLAGLSCGRAATTGFEPESDLSSLAVPGRLSYLRWDAAIYEVFSEHDNDLSGLHLHFNAPNAFKDSGEPNDTFGKATRVSLPYSSIDKFTAIAPVGQDIDFFRVELEAGATFSARTQGAWFLDPLAGLVSGGFDTRVGLFDAAGNLVAANDDAGDGGLFSKILYPVFNSGVYYVAVTASSDVAFTGRGSSGGRYILELSTITGLSLSLDDDDFAEVPLPFAFPFEGGVYSSVFINSNGNLTFGAGDVDYQPTVAKFLGGLPRIAPNWADMAPMYGGTITISQKPGTWTVAFDDVPEIGSFETTTFSVTLNATGRIEIRYGVIAHGLERIVGVTQGGGAPNPGETDLSNAATWPAVGTTYETFGHFESDLGFRVLTFEP